MVTIHSGGFCEWGVEESMKFKWTPVKKLILFIVAQMLIVVLSVWFFDPFYQYHEPFGGFKAVLNDRDNQMPGTVRNFTYDSVLIGSSVAENFDSGFLDAQYDCTTLKIIRASGSIADLLYYLEMAQQEHELKNVFWCLDLFALNAPVETTLYGEDIPRYLHTVTPFDDIPYVLNKEVLLVKIPYMLAGGYMGKNTDGHAYDWSEGKTFGAQKAMQAYQKPSEGMEAQDYSDDIPVIAENIAMLTEQIRKNPQITWRFLIPPYSLLWWDCAYVNGIMEEDFYILEQVIDALLSCENVELYYFQDEQEIVCNLDYYMDMIHYAPQVNQYMLEQMAAGEKKVTRENCQEVIQSMRQLALYITEEEIYSYYR